jgi:uncharacterized protein (DUF849 family)
VLIKAAINGGRTKAEHAATPVGPEEQAADVVECLRAGAGAIHLHVRVTFAEGSGPDVCAPSEKESLDADDVARTLVAVRAAIPNAAIDAPTPRVGVSTGAWILPHPARLQAVGAWEVLPDFASVNFAEDGAVELARLLLSRGVDVEAGLSDEAAAEILVTSGLTANCIRVLIEPQEQEFEQALETVNSIEKILGVRAEPRSLSLPPVLLHGTEATAWPMLDAAIARGYDVRIGLEDTLVLPDGKLAKDNSELVTEAVRRLRAGS